MIPKGTSHTSLLNSTNEVPKGTMKTRPSSNYFNIGPPKPDTYRPYKALDVKIPEGTNLPNQ
jgi:hypothetical protein